MNRLTHSGRSLGMEVNWITTTPPPSRHASFPSTMVGGGWEKLEWLSRQTISSIDKWWMERTRYLIIWLPIPSIVINIEKCLPKFQFQLIGESTSISFFSFSSFIFLSYFLHGFSFKYIEFCCSLYRKLYIYFFHIYIYICVCVFIILIHLLTFV